CGPTSATACTWTSARSAVASSSTGVSSTASSTRRTPGTAVERRPTNDGTTRPDGTTRTGGSPSRRRTSTRPGTSRPRPERGSVPSSARCCARCRGRSRTPRTPPTPTTARRRRTPSSATCSV
ncbi:MAG: hypothetical protein AVDCRST_MAG57-493, partial [uncultured Blastococcus sp.]